MTRAVAEPRISGWRLLGEAGLSGLVALLWAAPALRPDLHLLRWVLLVGLWLGLGGRWGLRLWRSGPVQRGPRVGTAVAGLLLWLLCGLGSVVLIERDRRDLFCEARIHRMEVVPTGYPELHPHRATWRWTWRCALSGRQPAYYRQSGGLLLGPKVEDRG